MRSKLVIATISMLAKISEAADGKCRALVLSGGSNNGAWEAGVMWGLLHYGNPTDFAWDTVSGVSAGAINTGGIATWEKGTELEMTEWLSLKWQTMQNEDLYYYRQGSTYEILFKEPSFLDDTPALTTLNDIYSETGGEIKRHFVVSAVDVNTGDYVPMTDKDTPFENLARSTLSSGSIQVVFPPQHLNGHVFMDGGTVYNVNLNTAVEQCLEIVDDISDVIVDVAVCAYYSPPGQDVSKNARENYQSANSIKDYYTGGNALFAQAEAYPGLDIRYYFQERNSCPGAGGLDFTNQTTWCLQEAGRADAKAMLNIGSDKISDTMEEWKGDYELRRKFPFFRDYLNSIFNYFL